MWSKADGSDASFQNSGEPKGQEAGQGDNWANEASGPERQFISDFGDGRGWNVRQHRSPTVERRLGRSPWEGAPGPAGCHPLLTAPAALGPQLPSPGA